MRQKGVLEYLVNGVMYLYKGCKTGVSVDGELSSSFSVKVGVHQASALSPFLSIMDVLTGCEGWFINGVVVCRRSCFESLNEVMDKYERWKNAAKGRV